MNNIELQLNMFFLGIVIAILIYVIYEIIKFNNDK